MAIEFDELPGWIFNIKEVSNGVYRVSGKDKDRRNIERTGTDPDMLLGECKKWAMQLMAIKP